jgi:hypothetical protein
MTWNVDVYNLAAWWAVTWDVARRAVTSFEFRLAVKNVCITDIMNDFFCRHSRWLETWICTLVQHDEMRRAATCIDELWISYYGENYMLCCRGEMIEIFSRHITWLETWICTFLRHDELWCVATCFNKLWVSYYGEKYMFYYRCNDWIFFRHNIWLETWMCTFVKITSCDVPWCTVTSFKFRIVVKNIYCITDVMIEIFIVTSQYMTWNVVVYIRATWRATTCRDLMWRALNLVMRKVAVSNIAPVCRDRDKMWLDVLRRVLQCISNVISHKNSCDVTKIHNKLRLVSSHITPRPGTACQTNLSVHQHQTTMIKFFALLIYWQ